MTVGRASQLNVVGNDTVEKVQVQTECLDYFTRNIKSFGSSLVCVVSDIDKTDKRAFNLSSQ